MRRALLSIVVVAGGAAIVSWSCKSGGDILRTGGEIAAAATGEEGFKDLGDAASRSIQDYNDVLPSEEHYIGRAVAAQVLVDPRYPMRADDAVTTYVRMVGLSVAEGSDTARRTFKGYHFVVLDSPELNAFAAPGGFVFVTTGLLKITKNEDELAAILAHEIAHVTLKHGLQAIKQSNFVEAGQLGLNLYGKSLNEKDKKKLDQRLGQLSQVFGRSVDEVVFTLVSGGYGADKERAADELAVRLLASAGYDPHGLGNVLEHMPHGASGSGGWLATHPAPETRIQTARAVERQVQDPTTPAAIATRAARHDTAFALLP